MTQEDKDLLLKYLCMALPYGIKVRNVKNKFDIYDFNHNVKEIKTLIEEYNIKPYLRPMSSMTEEEEKEWADLFNKPLIELDKYSDKDAEEIAPQMFAMSHTSSINWLLKNHFDFMGLIPKGLAIEVTNENNPYEE